MAGQPNHPQSCFQSESGSHPPPHARATALQSTDLPAAEVSTRRQAHTGHTGEELKHVQACVLVEEERGSGRRGPPDTLHQIGHIAQPLQAAVHREQHVARATAQGQSALHASNAAITGTHFPTRRVVYAAFPYMSATRKAATGVVPVARVVPHTVTTVPSPPASGRTSATDGVRPAQHAHGPSARKHYNAPALCEYVKKHFEGTEHVSNEMPSPLVCTLYSACARYGPSGEGCVTQTRTVSLKAVPLRGQFTGAFPTRDTVGSAYEENLQKGGEIFRVAKFRNSQEIPNPNNCQPSSPHGASIIRNDGKYTYSDE